MIGAMLGLGYATANYFGLAFYYASDPTVSWRAPLGLQLFFPLMILCLLPFVPESPRYFLMMDKKEEAWSVIEKLHDDPTDSEKEFARREFYQMAQQAAYDRTINSSWVELFRRSSYRKRILFGMFLMILCQSTGELVLNQYVRPTSKPTAFQKGLFNVYRNRNQNSTPSSATTPSKPSSYRRGETPSPFWVI